ncbi:MAG: TonB-dependent receptor [Vicinamibacteraceae bacterium]
MPDAVLDSIRSFHPAAVRRHRWRAVCLATITALLATCLGAPAAAADVVGLTGRVTDGHGGAIAAAAVRVRREDGSVNRGTASDAAGTFTIAALPAGDYVVEVEKVGFRADVAIVSVSGRRTVTHDVELGAAGVRETVVVTASGLPQSTLETSKAVTVIDSEEITARNAVSLADVVRLTPGVQVRDSGGPGQLGSVRLRGLRSDGAAVLVDGVRLRDAASTQGDVTGFWSNLAIVDVDRVEILRGSASSLYGTNAVGGAINIVTREGGPQRSEGQLEFGSLGHSRVRGATSGSLAGGRVAYSAGALHWLVRDGVDGDDRARNVGGQGSVRGQLDAATSLGVRFYGSSARVRTNTSPTAGGVPATNIPDETIVDAIGLSLDELARANAGQAFAVGDATFLPGRNDPDNARASHFQTTAVTLRRVESDRASWQASYQRVGTHRRYDAGPLGPGFQTETLAVSEFDGTIDTVDARGHVQPASWLTVTGGYEFERERYADRQDDNAVVARLRTTTDISQTAHALFGAAQVSALDRRLQVALAGRLQTFRSGELDLSATGADHPYDDVDVEGAPRALTGDVSVAYLIPASGTKVRGHVGNAYRAPALYERFGGGFFGDPATGRVFYSAYGDPRLRPDRYRSFDAGVDQTLAGGRVQIAASAFVIDVQSLTAFDFSGGIDPSTDPFGRFLGYLNGSGGSSKGLELAVDVRPTSTLRVSGSYAFTRARTDDALTVPDFFRVPGVQEHTASLYVTRQWSSRVDTTLDLLAGGESYGSFFARGRTRAYRYPGVTTVGVSSSVRLTPVGAADLRAYVRVDNLTDETAFTSGWRAPGRTGVVGLRAAF